MNGIRAWDSYVIASIYFEVDLDNLFYRKQSEFESYYATDEDFNKI